MVGGGKNSLPSNVRLRLELLDERPFGNGMVYLHYRVQPGYGGSSEGQVQEGKSTPAEWFPASAT